MARITSRRRWAWWFIVANGSMRPAGLQAAGQPGQGRVGSDGHLPGIRKGAATRRPVDADLRSRLPHVPRQPGLVLADLLRRTGGVYETTTTLSPQFRDDIREVAELTSDPELLAIADLTEVPVPLEHLRGLDPQTRIVIRAELRYEADDDARVRRRTREHRPTLATVMPDGTVIAGDAFPVPPAPTSLRARLAAQWPNRPARPAVACVGDQCGCVRRGRDAR
jgi:hypothetical protein